MKNVYWFARLLAVALIFTLPACGGDGTGPADNSPTLAGTWEGPILSGVLTATMTDSRGTVSGSGAIDGSSLICAPAIAGTRTGANFNLTFTCTGFQPFTYAGTVTATTLTGNLTGSGFNGDALTLTKQ